MKKLEFKPNQTGHMFGHFPYVRILFEFEFGQFGHRPQTDNKSEYKPNQTGQNFRTTNSDIELTVNKK